MCWSSFSFNHGKFLHIPVVSLLQACITISKELSASNVVNFFYLLYVCDIADGALQVGLLTPFNNDPKDLFPRTGGDFTITKRLHIQSQGTYVT